jgi:hypothetical protein
MGGSSNFFLRASIDLVAEATAGRLPTIHGRDDEAREVLALLRDRRSVLLVGPTGAGKTAVVNRVAALLAESAHAPRLYSITTAQIIATPQGYIGQWQAQLQSVIDGVQANDGILYYTDIWLTPGAGRSDGSEDNIWDALAPLIERRKLTLLCECQTDLVKAVQRRVPGMLDRFASFAVDALDERGRAASWSRTPAGYRRARPPRSTSPTTWWRARTSSPIASSRIARSRGRESRCSIA